MGRPGIPERADGQLWAREPRLWFWLSRGRAGRAVEGKISRLLIDKGLPAILTPGILTSETQETTTIKGEDSDWPSLPALTDLGSWVLHSKTYSPDYPKPEKKGRDQGL